MRRSAVTTCMAKSGGRTTGYGRGRGNAQPSMWRAIILDRICSELLKGFKQGCANSVIIFHTTQATSERCSHVDEGWGEEYDTKSIYSEVDTPSASKMSLLIYQDRALADEGWSLQLKPPHLFTLTLMTPHRVGGDSGWPTRVDARSPNGARMAWQVGEDAPARRIDPEPGIHGVRSIAGLWCPDTDSCRACIDGRICTTYESCSSG